MCPLCGSEMQIDFIDRIANRDIAQFVEKCTSCPYRLSVIEFNADYYEDSPDSY